MLIEFHFESIHCAAPVLSGIFNFFSGYSPGRFMIDFSMFGFKFFAQILQRAFGALLALCLKARVPQLKTIVRIGLISGGLLSWIIVAGIFRIKDDLASPTALRLISGYTLVALGCALLFIGFLGARIPFS